MAREKRFHIRLTEEEFEELHLEAERRDVSMAEVMRDLIKTLRRRRRPEAERLRLRSDRHSPHR